MINDFFFSYMEIRSSNSTVRRYETRFQLFSPKWFSLGLKYAQLDLMGQIHDSSSKSMGKHTNDLYMSYREVTEHTHFWPSWMARWIEADNMDVMNGVAFRLFFCFIWFRHLTGKLPSAKGWCDQLGFSMFFWLKD